jgi:hypothetical protein
VLLARGAYYPPQEAAIATRNESSNPAGAATKGSAPTPVASISAGDREPGSGGAPAAPPIAPAVLLPPAIPESTWTRDGGIEAYPEDRLYEKIDGADERYKLYGVTQLLYASYVPEQPSDNWLEVYLYEMRTPLAALGIFGRERSPGVSVDASLGEAGYRIEGSVFFRRGTWYVQIRGYTDSAKEAGEKFARYVAGRLPGGVTADTDFAFFPAENRIQGSERFEPKDAVLGTGFLENIFSAEYLAGDTGTPSPAVILFAVNCGDAAAAGQAAARYAEHVRRRGKLLKEEEIDDVTVTLMDLDGLFEGFWTTGVVFAGVAEVRDQTTLRKYVAALVRSLEAATVPRIAEPQASSPSPPYGRSGHETIGE